MNLDKVKVIDEAVCKEFIIRVDALLNKYQEYFSSEPSRLLNALINYKMQWLESIWKGRDRVQRELDLEQWEKDPIVSCFVLRSRMRRKRRWEENFGN